MTIAKQSPQRHPFWNQEKHQFLLERTQNALMQAQGDFTKAIYSVRKECSIQGVEFHASTMSRAMEICAMRWKFQELLSSLRESSESNALREKYKPLTEQGIFTRVSLEQSTHPLIAEHHARRFRNFSSVLEICTGVGFDTIALAQEVERITSIEADTETAHAARHNLHVMGLHNVEVLSGTAESILNKSFVQARKWEGLWSDPSRRTVFGTRLQHPEEYHPKLSFLMSSDTITSHILKRIGVKISPAHDIEYLEEKSTHFSVNQEWVAFGKECREQVVWADRTDRDRSISTTKRVFVSFPEKRESYPRDFLCEDTITHQNWKKERVSVVEYSSDKNWLVNYFLVEPHKALVRSGCMELLFSELAISLFDQKIAYGIAEPDSLLLQNNNSSKLMYIQQFKILSVLPYNKKAIQRKITELGWTDQTEVKKRGFPLDAQQIRKLFRFRKNIKHSTANSKTRNVLIITRKGDKHFAFFTEAV